MEDIKLSDISLIIQTAIKPMNDQIKQLFDDQRVQIAKFNDFMIEIKLKLSNLGCSESNRMDKFETKLADLQNQIKSNTNVNETKNAIKEYKKDLMIKISWWIGSISILLGIILTLTHFGFFKFSG